MKISVDLDDEIYEDLEEYRSAWPFPPTRTDVVERAVAEFLERQPDPSELQVNQDDSGGGSDDDPLDAEANSTEE